MYMARQDPRRNRKERRTERRTEISEKNEEGRGTRKKDWHGSIEEGERGGRRKTKKKIVADASEKDQSEGTGGEQERKISTMKVKEGQKKRSGEEQGQRWSKFVRSKAKY